ncbi:Vacuolar protein sorting-associated protein 62 [Penicillium cinerascens]|uniref:Vacuolar protein sorting-associated protein 62 n=1 Tax=Penicillium cinerascens TaxID=70096 RepID=A0A9W9JKH5_9EURO|nr:Vacuolar protein sorting-associated protein 62 [Penicillium cinerascens]KAJ5197721.1 Vacuolar protein sorting-associated protein 62 [Penicillium cinerascens]
MTRKARATIVSLLTLIVYLLINSLFHALKPTAFVWYEEDEDEPSWTASSRSWLDRKSCRWLGVCGVAHFQTADAQFGQHSSARLSESKDTEPEPWRSFWFCGSSNRSKWDAEEWARREIPDYVFDYAPLVHLYSGELFWPGDIAEHLYHTTPMLNYTPVQAQWDHPTLEDLDDLNQWEGGRHVFLTSDDDVQTQPPWLEGEKNIPESDEKTKESWPDWDGRVDGEIPDDTELDRAKWFDLRHRKGEDTDKVSAQAHRLLKQELHKRYGGKKIQDPLQDTRTEEAGGRSDAPAILLLMDKGNGVVDAFWFFFYGFNLGNTVVNMRFGNHVGDWEHCLVRFYDGQPKVLFFSAHAAGEAYRYEAVEKIGQRPVIYSAEGSHAMYATTGVHEYILPWGLLHDVTDRGPLWDPLLNTHAYTYDFDNDALRASTFSPASPTEWFHFRGHWGDKFYRLSDSRQYRFAGQYHYVNGPLGPRFKHLNRRQVCQGPDRAPCVIKDWIEEDKRTPRWDSVGVGE